MNADQRKLRFLITMMFRAVFHNRALLDMITVGLGKELEGNKEACKLLADVYELCEVQSKAEMQPTDTPEIEAAMKKLDQAVAKLLTPPDPDMQPYSAFIKRDAERAYQSERGSNFRSSQPARMSNDVR